MLVSSDLQARARVENAAAAAGLDWRSLPPDADYDPKTLAGAVAVLDLDQMGSGVRGWMGAAMASESPPARVLGFFSHVQEDVGALARAAGVHVYPRGRFWRELPNLL